MTLRDDDILAIVNAEVGVEEFEDMLGLAGVPSTGNVVDDLKMMAATMGVDVEDLLYALFVADEPFFNEGTWTHLTNDEDL